MGLAASQPHDPQPCLAKTAPEIHAALSSTAQVPPFAAAGPLVTAKPSLLYSDKENLQPASAEHMSLALMPMNKEKISIGQDAAWTSPSCATAAAQAESSAADARRQIAEMEDYMNECRAAAETARAAVARARAGSQRAQEELTEQLAAPTHSSRHEQPQLPAPRSRSRGTSAEPIVIVEQVHWSALEDTDIAEQLGAAPRSRSRGREERHCAATRSSSRNVPEQPSTVPDKAPGKASHRSKSSQATPSTSFQPQIADDTLETPQAPVPADRIDALDAYQLMVPGERPRADSKDAVVPNELASLHDREPNLERECTLLHDVPGERESTLDHF